MREMKDSGIDWIGKIPIKWNTKAIRYFIKEHLSGSWGNDEQGNENDRVCVRIADFDYPKIKFKENIQYTIRNYSDSDIANKTLDCSMMFGVTSPDYRVFRLRNKENNDLTYFKYIMQCCYMSRIFYSLGQGVSNLGRWRLQTTAFNNFMIPVPPFDEQKEIAQYLDKKISEIDTIIAEKKQQIRTIEEYKKSLIFEYVTGKKEVL